MFTSIIDIIKKKITLYLDKALTDYKMEILFLSISLISFVFSLSFFIVSYKNQNNNKIAKIEKPIHSEEKTEEPEKPENIFVDISGSVENPGLYELSKEARLNDVLREAGGLSKEAHAEYFYRNFNLSRLLQDQEKIYIPSKKEIDDGRFTEDNFTLNNFEDSTESNNGGSNISININTADQAELEELPGVGEKTAEKIIGGRPYNSPEDLLEKKAVGEALYEKIRTLITVE